MLSSLALPLRAGCSELSTSAHSSLKQRFARIGASLTRLEGVSKTSVAGIDAGATLKENIGFVVKESFTSSNEISLQLGRHGRVFEVKEDGAWLRLCGSKDLAYIDSSDFDKLVVDSVVCIKYAGLPLPEWSYPPEVLKVDPYFAENDCCTGGPALLKAIQALWAAFILFIIAPVVVFVSIGRCPDDGVAMVPAWVFLLLAMGPVGLVCLEESVRYYSLAPLVLVLAVEEGFGFAGFAMSFRTWIWHSRAVSLIVHADIVTSGVFMAKALMSECGARRVVWQEAMRQSAGGAILENVPFYAFVVVGWLFMLLQFIYAFAATWVVKEPDTHGVRPRAEVHYGFIYSWQTHFGYSTLLSKATDHGECLQIVAGTARQTSVTSKNVDYLLAVPCDSSDYADLLRRMVFRFTLFNLLQTAYQLNLQSAGLAINQVTNHALDWQTLISIGLSLATSTTVIRQQASDLMSVRRNLKEEADYEADDQSDCSSNSPNWKFEKAERSKMAMKVYFRIFLCLLALYVLLLLRAALQTYMTIFVCQRGIYNMGIGCVNVGSARA